MTEIYAALAGALVGGFLTIFVSRQKIKADLRASTRLEWISEVRKLTSDIINEHQKAEKLVTNFYTDRQKEFDGLWDKVDAYDMEIQKIESEISNKVTLYKLYFSVIKRNQANVYQDNFRNREMHIFVDKVLAEVTQYKDNLYTRDFKKIVNEDGSSVIEDFRNAASNYIKKEWDRAKDNK